MSALPLKADVCSVNTDVRYVQKQTPKRSAAQNKKNPRQFPARGSD